MNNLKEKIDIKLLLNFGGLVLAAYMVYQLTGGIIRSMNNLSEANDRKFGEIMQTINQANKETIDALNKNTQAVQELNRNLIQWNKSRTSTNESGL